MIGSYELLGEIFMYSLTLCYNYDEVTKTIPKNASWTLFGLFAAQVFWPALVFFYFFFWTFGDDGSIDLYQNNTKGDFFNFNGE